MLRVVRRKLAPTPVYIFFLNFNLAKRDLPHSMFRKKTIQEWPVEWAPEHERS
jgi:hypothetical protein